MTDYIIVPRADYKNACDSIRTQTGKTALLKSGELSAAIDSIPLKEVIEGTVTNITLPSDLTRIRDNAFDGCKNMVLTSLPDGVTEIGAFAFYLCESLISISFSNKLEIINTVAFANCEGLTTITFAGTPYEYDWMLYYIAEDAFTGCDNLTTINVPWDEDEIPDAPWGAVNATINYNYAG